MSDIRSAFRFFLEHAGYCVGARARGALALARAEADAKKIGITFKWDADEPYDMDAGCCDANRRRAKFLRDDGRTMEARAVERAHTHDAEYCAARFRGETLESLGGIADADKDYRRVVEAELALQALERVSESFSYLGAH